MSTLTDTAKNLGTMKLASIGVATAVLIAFFIMITFRVSTGGMSPLYSGLSISDSSKIVSELEKMDTPYELKGDGTQIMVPTDKVLRIRMTMAQQNLPGNGSMVGYEIFDRSDTFGSSNFVMNINMLRALEGELSRTINSLSSIESSRVHIVMPKQELFTRQQDQPSASVTVKVRGNNAMESSEVQSITHLVAAAVPKLSASRVAVIDNLGRLLARGDGDESMSSAASSTEEFRIAYEKRLRNAIESMIERVIGYGKVQAKVTADINFDRTTINSETFDPEGQVARSIQSNSAVEKSQEAEQGGTVTVSNNIPPGAEEGAEGGNSHMRETADEITNYEISKTIQSKVREGGTVNKLSVAVLVDGNYTTNDDGNKSYEPRSQEELEKLEKLVASAIGYDEKRGDIIEVVNMRFTTDGIEQTELGFFDKFKVELQSIIQTLMIAIVSILAIMLVLRPAVVHMVKHTTPHSERVTSDLAAIEGHGGGSFAEPPPEEEEDESLIDVANIKDGLKTSTVRKLTEVVDKYPEESMLILRQWADNNPS